MENLEVSAKKRFTLDKFLSQVKVSASSNVKKVLGISAKSVISSCESANGYCSISGRLNVNVIYLSENGVVESANNFYDFIEKQACSYEVHDAVAHDRCSVESTNYSSSEVIVGIAHNVQVDGIFKYQLADISNLPEEFVASKNEFSALKLANVSEDNFVIAEECDANIKNLVVLGANANILSYEAMSVVDKVVIEGKLGVEVVYRDDETVGSVNREFEFKQEVAADGVVPNMLVSSAVEVRNVNVTPEAKEDKTNLVFAFDVFAKNYVFEDETYQAISDMFSLKNELQTTYDYIDAKNYDSSIEASDVCLSSTNVSEIENLDDIISIFSPEVEIKDVTEEDDKVTATGELRAVALYRSGEEISSLPVVSGIRYEVEKDKAQTLGGIVASAEVSTFKVKAGKELEASFKVSYHVDFDTKVSERYIKSYELGQDKDEQTGGVKVYITREGETLFEVAKVLNVRPEVITSQNEVADTFERGEKIYIYSPINLL